MTLGCSGGCSFSAVAAVSACDWVGRFCWAGGFSNLEQNKRELWVRYQLAQPSQTTVSLLKTDSSYTAKASFVPTYAPRSKSQARPSSKAPTEAPYLQHLPTHGVTKGGHELAEACRRCQPTPERDKHVIAETVKLPHLSSLRKRKLREKKISPKHLNSLSPRHSLFSSMTKPRPVRYR